MDVIVRPGTLSGSCAAVASKSHMHRLLVCAALCEGETRILHGPLCEDIDATCRSLCALGASIDRRDGATIVRGIGSRRMPEAVLDCGESGSTYRFLLPVACALGTNAAFLLSGRLPQRPMTELMQQLSAHGAHFSGEGSARVCSSGKLSGGLFTLPGNISSQYITALLFAMPLTGEHCALRISKNTESAAYIDLTLSVLSLFGIRFERGAQLYRCAPGQQFCSPGVVHAEGDWSNAAFALCAASASGASVQIEGLCADSVQGDKAVLDVVRRFGAKADLQNGRARVTGEPLRACMVDLSQIPDMAPSVALLGAMAQGESVLCGTHRLRLKESDRVESILAMLRALGAEAWTQGDDIHIRGTGGAKLPGGTVDSCGDHRIAMASACAAAICSGPVVIRGAQCVAKSYPAFFDDLPKLGLKGEKLS